MATLSYLGVSRSSNLRRGRTSGSFAARRGGETDPRRPDSEAESLSVRLIVSSCWKSAPDLPRGYKRTKISSGGNFSRRCLPWRQCCSNQDEWRLKARFSELGKSLQQ